MLFETPLKQETLGVVDTLDLPLPQFDDGVKCQQVYVRVWIPKEYRLVGDPDGFTNHIRVSLLDARNIDRAPDQPDSWFPQDASSFDFQVGGTTYLYSSLEGPTELTTGYWRISVMTLIASLSVLLLGLLLIPFSVETKVGAAFVGAFAVLFAALFFPSTAYSWLLAARLGIAGVIAAWLVVWLLYLRKNMQLRPAPPQQQESPPAPEPELVVAADAPASAVPTSMNENEISWRDHDDK